MRVTVLPPRAFGRIHIPFNRLANLNPAFASWWPANGYRVLNESHEAYLAQWLDPSFVGGFALLVQLRDADIPLADGGLLGDDEEAILVYQDSDADRAIAILARLGIDARRG